MQKYPNDLQKTYKVKYVETLETKIQSSSIFNMKVVGDALEYAIPLCE